MANSVIPHATEAAVKDAVLALGEVVWDRTLSLLRIGDGATPGGRAIGTADVMIALVQAGIAPALAQVAAGVAAAGASADAAAASSAAILAARIGTGEMAHDVVIAVNAANGASNFTRSSTDETIVGYSIPAGSQGQTSSIVPYFLIPAEMVARFAGATINMVGVYQHEAGFPAAKTINDGLGCTAIRVDGTSGNTGAAVASGPIDATRYRRETSFVLATDMVRVGQWFQLSGSVSTASAWTARLVSLTVRCTAVPAGTAYTAADVNAWLSAYQTDRPSIGPVLSVATLSQTANGGAVARVIGGRVVGATIPAGQSGANTNTLVDLPVAAGWAATLAGQVPWVVVLVRHSAGITRPLVLRLQRQAGSDIVLNNSRVISISATSTLYIARGHWNAPLTGGETFLRAYMRITPAATVTSAEEYFEIADVHWGVAIDATQSPADAAARVRDARLRDAVAIGDAALQAQINASNVNISALIAAQTTGWTAAGQQIATGAYAAGTFNFSRWAVAADQGTDFDLRGRAAAAVRFGRVTTAGDAATIRLRLWRRPLSAASPDSYPGRATDSAVTWAGVAYADYPVGDLGIVPGGAAADIRMILPAPIPAADLDGMMLLMDMQALNAQGAPVRLGSGFTGGQTAALAQRHRGWYGSADYGNVADTSLRVSWGIDSVAIFDAAGNEVRLKGIETSVAKLDPTFASDFLLPDRLYLTAGRPLALNAGMMASTRIEVGNLDVTAESLKYAPAVAVGTAPKPALAVRGSPVVTLDPDAIAGSVLVTIRKRGSDNLRWQKSIPATVVPWAKTGSPRILILGDSLAAQMKVSALYQELVARGMTPTMIGDLRDLFGVYVTGGEGRGGKCLADFLYMRAYSASNVNTMKPCDTLSYADYTALPRTGAAAGDDAKERRNPFLVASTGTGSYNGYKWSLAQYLAYTGKAAPTHVYVSLGTNDSFQRPGTFLADIAAGIPHIVREIRAVSADIQIGFYSDGLGWKGEINAPGGYYEVHHAMLRAQYNAVAAIRAAGDTKVVYLPLGAHQDENRFGLMTIQSTDGYGLRTVVDDAVQAGYLHPTDSNVFAAASVLAAHVVATS